MVLQTAHKASLEIQHHWQKVQTLLQLCSLALLLLHPEAVIVDFRFPVRVMATYFEAR